MDVIFERTKAMGDLIETSKVAFYDATPTVATNALVQAMNVMIHNKTMARVYESIKEDMK